MVNIWPCQISKDVQSFTVDAMSTNNQHSKEEGKLNESKK